MSAGELFGLAALLCFVLLAANWLAEWFRSAS